MFQFKIHSEGSNKYAEVLSKGVIINTVDDALDLIGNASYNECTNVIINAENLHPDFFELKTGLAGEILQKFSNYRMKLAILGNFNEVESKSLRDFIFESNKGKRIVFLNNIEEAFIFLKN